MTPLPAALETALAGLPPAMRAVARAALEGHPEKWDWTPPPPPDAGPPRPAARVAARAAASGRPPNPGRCPYQGAGVIERWRSNCMAKVDLLSVRACDHPDSPGKCARGDDPAHVIAGVRVCHGRGCPLAAAVATAAIAPTLSVIVPTCGRPPLARALDSIKRQLGPGDELLVEHNAEPWGNAARNRLIARAKGDALVFMDDDDTFTPGAFVTIRAALAREPDRVHLFRMRHPDGRVLWQDRELREGNVSTQMFCVPNRPGLVGRFGDRYAGDFDFIRATCGRMGPPVWHEDIIALYRPEDVPAAPAASGYTRHLLYFCLPVSGNGAWRWNVDQLLRRIDLFDGRRVLAVATANAPVRPMHSDRPTAALDSADAVRAAVAGHGFEVVEVANNPGVGEGAAFEALFGRAAEHAGPRDVTFYGHAKGVSYAADDPRPVRLWAEVLYAANLDFWPLIEREFRRGRWFVGSMRQADATGHFIYSGNYFWAKNSAVFGLDFKQRQPEWLTRLRAEYAGVELWPGRMAHARDAGVLFKDYPKGMQAYDTAWMAATAAEFAEWSKAHAADRTTRAGT